MNKQKMSHKESGMWDIFSVKNKPRNSTGLFY